MSNMLCALTLSVPGGNKARVRHLLAQLLLDNNYYVNYNVPSDRDWGAIIRPRQLGYVALTHGRRLVALSPKSRQ